MSSSKVIWGKAEIHVGTYKVYSDQFLGKGGYGVVFTATDAKGNKVAAKCIDGKDKHKMQKITKNLDKLMTLDHANIVKIFDIHQDDTTIWMFMEFCEFGDLKDFFHKQKLTECQKLKLMKQVAQGVNYLHNHNIIHRDIKPANILIASEKPIVAKLTDFDLSKFLEPNYDTSLIMTNVGTLAFKAPEFFQINKEGSVNYHSDVDIFASGLTFLAMIQGHKGLVPRIETPNNDSELHLPIGSLIAERIKYGKKPLDVIHRHEDSMFSKLLKSVNLGTQAPKKPPSSVKELIQRMTCVVPEQRISAREVVHILDVLTVVSFSRHY